MIPGRRTSIIDMITGGHRRNNSDEEAQDEANGDKTTIPQHLASPEFVPTLESSSLIPEPVFDAELEYAAHGSSPPAIFGYSDSKVNVEGRIENLARNSTTEAVPIIHEGFERGIVATGGRESTGPSEVPRNDIVFVSGRQRPRSSQVPLPTGFQRDLSFDHFEEEYADKDITPTALVIAMRKAWEKEIQNFEISTFTKEIQNQELKKEIEEQKRNLENLHIKIKNNRENVAGVNGLQIISNLERQLNEMKGAENIKAEYIRKMLQKRYQRRGGTDDAWDQNEGNSNDLSVIREIVEVQIDQIQELFIRLIIIRAQEAFKKENYGIAMEWCNQAMGQARYHHFDQLQARAAYWNGRALLQNKLPHEAAKFFDVAVNLGLSADGLLEDEIHHLAQWIRMARSDPDSTVDI